MDVYVDVVDVFDIDDSIYGVVVEVGDVVHVADAVDVVVHLYRFKTSLI